MKNFINIFFSSLLLDPQKVCIHSHMLVYCAYAYKNRAPLSKNCTSTWVHPRVYAIVDISYMIRRHLKVNSSSKKQRGTKLQRRQYQIYISSCLTTRIISRKARMGGLDHGWQVTTYQLSLILKITDILGSGDGERRGINHGISFG